MNTTQTKISFRDGNPKQTFSFKPIKIEKHMETIRRNPYGIQLGSAKEIEILFEILNEMPNVFGGKIFAKCARQKGISNEAVSNGITTEFLKRQTKRMGGKNSKLWCKKEIIASKINENGIIISPEEQSAIDLLKASKTNKFIITIEQVTTKQITL